MSKIVIVGLINQNLGDRIILETCNYLVSKIAKTDNIKFMNLFPPDEIMKNHKITPKKNYLLQVCTFLRWLYHSSSPDVREYYSENLKDADMVIFAGGGIIKHTKENFWNAIYTITTICEEQGSPIYFNAVGVEGYNKFSFYSQILKYVLNRHCVKFLSTRDDLENAGNYISDENKTALVGDPALYISDLYPKVLNNKDKIIGIGVIRGRIFIDYWVKFTEKDIINSYVSLIKELESKGYRWKLFCNGIERDYEIGIKILEQLNLPVTEEFIAPRPKTPKDLLNIITSFSAIFAARLHANIIAASYQIPSVGLVWNDKLRLFGKIIGFSERFITKDQFKDSAHIVDLIEKAMDEGYDCEKLKQLKTDCFNGLETFINSSKEKNSQGCISAL